MRLGAVVQTAGLIALWLGCSSKPLDGGSNADGSSMNADGGSDADGGYCGMALAPVPCGPSPIAIPDCRLSTCQQGECFAVTAERSICALGPAPDSRETCRDDIEPGIGGGTAPLSDECGCPGRSCQPGQECRMRQIYTTGQQGSQNVCGVDACHRNEDCPAGQVCSPPAVAADPFFPFFRCEPADCRSDNDCPPCTRCLTSLTCGDQGTLHYRAPRCL